MTCGWQFLIDNEQKKISFGEQQVAKVVKFEFEMVRYCEPTPITWSGGVVATSSTFSRFRFFGMSRVSKVVLQFFFFEIKKVLGM